MQKWEYKTLIRCVSYQFKSRLSTDLIDIFSWSDGNPKNWDERLNELGEDGWELVSIYPTASYYGENWAGITSYMRLVFKRPK